MRKNEELQYDVLQAINWEPFLKNEIIGVSAKDGVVTLTGYVDSLKKKHEIEDAAKSVVGVKAIVEKIELKYNDANKNEDGIIATEVLNVLKWNLTIANQKIKVENGFVTIEGELLWKNQKESVKYIIGSILGVKGVVNNINIVSEKNKVEKTKIELALVRNWAINEQDITVNVSGSQVTLTGVVHSLYQKEQAERISWNAQGVGSVVNKLNIR